MPKPGLTPPTRREHLPPEAEAVPLIRDTPAKRTRDLLEAERLMRLEREKP
jgi:hypothetical protein